MKQAWSNVIAHLGIASLVRIIGALMMAISLSAPAAVLKDEAFLVGSEVLPVSRVFDVAQSGTYELQLTDLGFPANLQSVKAVVTHGTFVVASSAAAGKVQFDATAGQYKVLVAGIPAVVGGFGSIGVKVVAVSGGSVVLDYSDSIQGTSVPASPGQSTLQTQFSVTTAGSYRVTLADAAFPAALGLINVLITRGGVEYARLDTAHPTADFTAPVGTYDLLAVAQASSPALAGLYSVRVVNLGSGASVYDQTSPVGRIEASESVDLSGTGTYTLALSDLQFPQALSSLGAALTRGSTVLAKITTTGSVAFNTTPGAARLYTVHVAPTGGAGASAVELQFGGARFFSSVYVDSPALTTASVSLARSDFSVATAGQYRASLADFEFPGALAALQLAVVQDGQLLVKRTGPGTLDFQAATGKVQLLAAAQPNSGSGSGLTGVQVTALPGGAVVYETTQAVGALFEGRTLDIAQAGSYDLTFSDIGFPANFAELALAVTRGTTRVGSVVGGGKFSFQATPGTYFLNLVGRVNTSAKFGSYGLKVETTPPVPTVSLTAATNVVASGESTTVTWTTTGATSCVASDAWSGAKATSGSQAVGPLTVDSKYTLTCSGPGGTGAVSIDVTIKKAAAGGGGGAIDPSFLVALALLATVFRRGTFRSARRAANRR